MRRFSTPTHKFRAPFNPAVVKKLILTYEQNGKTVLEKTEADMTVEANGWSIILSQAETGAFAAGEVTAEIHFLTVDGEAGHIGPATIYVEDVQHKEVL
jgi:hypothetical protein